MDTLVVLEAEADDKTADYLLFFVEEELALRCPDIPCRTRTSRTSPTPNSLTDVARQAVEKAGAELAKDASLARCLYVKFLGASVSVAFDEICHLDGALLVVANRDGLHQRYFQPICDETLPSGALEILAREIVRTMQEFPASPLPAEEEEIADRLASTFFHGYSAAGEAMSASLQ